MLEKQKLDTEISQEQKALNCIVILEKRVITSKTTFIEQTYADLLIAQQLFSLKGLLKSLLFSSNMKKGYNELRF